MMLLIKRMYQTINNMKRPPNTQTDSENFARNAIRNKIHPKVTENFQRPTEYEHINNARALNTSKAVTKSTWGRPLWFSLHYGAINYPKTADNSMKNMMVGYIRGLPLMIPCDICKNHAYEYVSKFSDQQLMEISSSNESLFRFFWQFHNNVNSQTGKSTITLEKAYDVYMNNPTSTL
jgi:uncharacterized protein YozE (UPF0346 family)